MLGAGEDRGIIPPAAFQRSDRHLLVSVYQDRWSPKVWMFGVAGLRFVADTARVGNLLLLGEEVRASWSHRRSFKTGHSAIDVRASQPPFELVSSELMSGVLAGFVSRCVEELTARPLVWLWGELVAWGMVTSLAGPGGVGSRL